MKSYAGLFIALVIASINFVACNPEWYLGGSKDPVTKTTVDFTTIVQRTVESACNAIPFLTQERGVIQKISVDWYAIVPDYNTNTRFAPDSLPAPFKVDGLRIVFSGEIGQIPPNVRMWGTPLKLTDIREE